METEKAGHEAEERLTPAPPNAVPRMEDLIATVQNGNQSPEALPQQTNGDVSWNHFKPNEGVNPRKSLGKKCSSPIRTQYLLDQSPHLRNGGVKHALSEPSLLEFHPSKKLRLDAELNGQDDSVTPSREAAKSDCSASELDCSPDLPKSSAEERDGSQEQKLDNNERSFSDESLYSLPRNKKQAFTNGAIVNSPSMEDMHSDLLAKKLPQCYPDHISVASRNTSKDDSSESPVSNDTPEETTDSPARSSGLPISSPNSLSREQERTSSEVHSGDGCASLATDEEEPHGQRFPLEDALASQDPCPNADEEPQPVRPTDSENGQNSPEGSSKNHHSDEQPSQNSCPRSPLQPKESEGLTHLINDNIGAVVENKDTDLSYPSQVLSPKLNSQRSPEKVQVDVQPETQLTGSPKSYSQQGTSDPAVSNPPGLSEGAPNQEPENHLTEPHAEGKNETNGHVSFEGEVEEMLQQTDPYPDVNWTDLNSSQPPQETGLPQPQREQQADVQSAGQMQNLGPMQGFQNQESNQSSFQQQEEKTQNQYEPQLAPGQIGYRSRPEWQQQHPEPPQIPTPHKELIESNKSQPLSQQYGIPQHQVENQFHTQMQQQHLLEGAQDIEQIQESGFLRQQPVPTPQSEGRMVSSALPHHQSQNSQSMGELIDQFQDSSQRQLNCQVFNRVKLEEEDIGLETEPNSSNCRSQNHQMQQQTQLNPTARTSPLFLNSTLPEVQTKQDAVFPYTQSEVRENCEMKTVKIPQLQNSQSTVTQKQYSHQHQTQPQVNHTEFPQTPPPPPPPPMYRPPQVPQGAHNQQPSVQMYPASEFQKMSHAQLQQGQLQHQNYREYQKHAALRMHLLQKQEKQGHQQNLNDFKHILEAIVCERGLRTEPRQDKELATPATQTAIKQEHPQMTFEQAQHKSIIATMEHQLKRYQLSPVFERKSLVIKSPHKFKVETSGPVTVLSTNANLGGEDFRAATQPNATSDLTPTKKMEPNINSFLESPLKLLDTPIKNLLDTPIKTQYEIPSCHCFDQISGKDDGPYYTHLGAAPSVAGIRELMEKRFGQSGSCIRIEKVVYTGKEGKSALGCPIAKWVIRRASVEEKVLVLVRERPGHTCESAAIVVVIIVWEGIPATLADQLYADLAGTLQRHGALTNRRCAFNEERTCACQGLDPDTCGASFSFGCSWSMYYNGCKFARSKVPRKFRLLGDDHKEEEKIEQHLQNLATLVGPKYKQMAPDAHANQVEYEHRAPDCRLGLKEGRPFSGVTACLDFCAHAHRDLHNMPGGSTVVCTLTREDNREIGTIPEDEQLHVLPLYKISSTDEFGSVEGQQEKIRSGAIQALSVYRRKVRMLAEPAKSCRQRNLEAKRGGANKDTPNSKAEKNPQATLKQSTLEKPGPNMDVSGSHPDQLHAEAAQLGHPPHPLNTPYPQQQQLRPPNTTPGSPQLSQQSYPRFPNPANPFSSTSPLNLCPQSPAPMSPHPSTIRANPYLNGSNTVNPYHGSLNPNSSYPGYQCNGSAPLDGFHPYYVSNQKQMDVYPHQRPQLCTDQQYYPHQHYRVDYPPRYNEPSLHVNGYSNCSTRPNVQPMGPYSTYGPNSGPDGQVLEAVPRPPSAHPTMDYSPASKSIEYNGYANSYLSQNTQMYLQDKDRHFHTQIKPEMNFHDVNGMGQGPPPMGAPCPTLIRPGNGPPNENVQGIAIKQECHPPGEAPTPNQKEEVWSDNEHSFLDPEIGGLAVAPSHGSILIECAKRELHATTPLKNPDRNHPTRISLVFYQHKNMIEAKHGLALWEAKMAEKTREKELDVEKHGAEGTPTKNKKAKREPPEFLENAELPFKRFIETLAAKSSSCTTNTYVSTSPYAFTKVTGPYNHYV